jgi:hypothetical protein
MQTPMDNGLRPGFDWKLILLIGLTLVPRRLVHP